MMIRAVDAHWEIRRSPLWLSGCYIAPDEIGRWARWFQEEDTNTVILGTWHTRLHIRLP